MIHSRDAMSCRAGRGGINGDGVCPVGVSGDTYMLAF